LKNANLKRHFFGNVIGKKIAQNRPPWNFSQFDLLVLKGPTQFKLSKWFPHYIQIKQKRLNYFEVILFHRHKEAILGHNV